MKAVLISIHPKWVERIANKEKTVEVRKTLPKIKTPFKCYIYCTKGENLFLTQKGVKSKTELTGYLMNGKVIGEYVCDWTGEITPHFDIDGQVNQYTHKYPAILGWDDCLSFKEMKAYLGNKQGRDMHISNIKIYDKPKELDEFKTIKCTNKRGSCSDCKTKPDCIKQITRPPQSWQYVEDGK